MGSIQIEVPDHVRRRTVNPAFISIDSGYVDEFSENFTDIVDYENNFKVLVFCEYFLYHFLFLFVFGPLLPILFYPFCGNFTRFRNMCLFGLKKDFFYQFFAYLCNVFVLFSYFYLQPKETYNIEIFGLISAICLRISVICVKYAHFSEKKLKYMKNVYLTFEEIESEFITNWSHQSDLTIDKELYRCILKNNIDTSIFRMFFLRPLGEEIVKLLDIDPKEFESPIEKSSSSASYSLSIRSHLDNPTEELWSKSIEIVKKTLLFSKLECHEGSHSGYMIARFLIKANKELFLTPNKILILSLTLAFISSSIPSIFRYVNYGFFFGETWSSITINLSLLLLNSYFTLANYAFVVYGILEAGRTEKLLSQLSNILSTQKVSDYYSKKNLPTLNIFCPISYKCWSFLNQIFRSYGEKYFRRIESDIGIFLFYNLIVVLLIFLTIFKVFDKMGSIVDLCYLIFELTTMLVAIFITLYKGAIINQFYDIHRAILKTNKNIISDFYTLYYVYFENPNFESDNEIYYHGATILNRDSENLSPKSKKVQIASHCQNLLNINDDIIEELAFSQERRPFKIFGIPTSMNLLKSLIAGLGTVLVAALQKMIKK